MIEIYGRRKTARLELWNNRNNMLSLLLDSETPCTILSKITFILLGTPFERKNYQKVCQDVFWGKRRFFLVYFRNLKEKHWKNLSKCMYFTVCVITENVLPHKMTSDVNQNCIIVKVVVVLWHIQLFTTRFCHPIVLKENILYVQWKSRKVSFGVSTNLPIQMKSIVGSQDHLDKI